MSSMNIIMSVITNPKFFPTLIIVLNLGATAMYAANCNVRMALYWLAAAVLNIVVTY